MAELQAGCGGSSSVFNEFGFTPNFPPLLPGTSHDMASDALKAH